MTGNDRADVLVVGAGILGAAVAAHLIDEHRVRVVVVDGGMPSSGTTGAGAGFVGNWSAGYADFFGPTELELQSYGIHYYQQLAADHPDVECHHNGNMYLATTDDGMRKWVESVVTHALAPAGTRALECSEVEELTGGVIPAGSVIGGALHPAGVQISAGRANRALIRRVINRGGDVRTETRVTGVLVDDGRVVGVRTDAGDIAAERVVLACGAWTNELLAGVGESVPLLRIVATRVISPPSEIPATMPTVMVPDLSGLWLREHRGGLTWGNGDGYAPLYELGGSTDNGRQPRRKELVARLDEAFLPKLRRLVPHHDTSIGWWVQGLPAMTPDRLFYAGPVQTVPGLFVVGGDNEAGVTHGPGLGRVMADLVLRDGCEWVDATAYRPDRFKPKTFATDADIEAAMPIRR